ncbi:hypothetical protein EG68_00259 [Paragonimus skrjabini miyazakii]|uniref:Uncharacterized protein n=1 Tax=Paragonimus skrjabini miyazakii TaxID=59628 RepID=A0A8S9ZAN2_9TREM|nr:hypothetical protein EG68_00259 [Paragonimus skrjabini miyazakii]
MSSLLIVVPFDDLISYVLSKCFHIYGTGSKEQSVDDAALDNFDFCKVIQRTKPAIDCFYPVGCTNSAQIRELETFSLHGQSQPSVLIAIPKYSLLSLANGNLQF